MVEEKWMRGQGHRELVAEMDIKPKPSEMNCSVLPMDACSLLHQCLRKRLFLWEDQQGLMASVPHLLHLHAGLLTWVIR